MTSHAPIAQRRTRIAAAVFLALIPGTLAAQERTDSTQAPATSLDAVVVSATRTEQSLKTLPTHVVVLDATRLTASAAQTVPDLLRSIPGFTTRDFQSGIVASPSQSIVSFRGLGGSSAGRALVLLDGIPAGDPFSGWLDWGRIPLLMLQSAEVVRGGASTVWGSRSLGGVINLRTVAPRRDGAQLMIEGGSLGTYHGTGVASVHQGGISASLGGDFWNTDGFVITKAEQAGSVDLPHATTNRAVSGKLTWDKSPALQLWAAGGTFTGGERPLHTEGYQAFDEGRGGLRWLAPNGGVATVALFANHRTAAIKSYTVNATRSSQVPLRISNSPARSVGLSTQWTQMFFEHHELSAGADLTSAEGSLSERFTYVGDSPTRDRIMGGAQRIAGVFIQDAASLGAGVHVVASLRKDGVWNSDATRTLRALDSGTVLADSSFSDRTNSQLTYSLGMQWQATPWMGWRTSTYNAFRAPSMYELYYARISSRGTMTEGNATLDAERLKGIELGLDLTPTSSLLGRFTVYRNRVASPIMDVTVGTAGTQAQVIAPCGSMPARQTCAQRRNVPGLLSTGVESQLEWHPSAMWTVGGGYAFSPTKVIAPGQPVDGNRAIRAALHTVTTSVAFDAPRWVSVAVEGRHVGPRYDDDLNKVQLDGFWLVGARVNRAIGYGLTTYLKVDNLLDEKFEIARTSAGLADMGAPRWITAGVRAAW